MKKTVILSILTAMLFLANSPKVNAQEATSLNDSETIKKFMEQAPSELIELYEEQNFIIGPDWFDDDGNLIPIVDVDVKYIETKTYISSDGEESNITSERELTAKEYAEWTPIQTRAACTSPPWGVADCWETTAKRIFMLVRAYEDGTERLDAINQWKTMPSVRSYDTIGIIYNDFDVITAWGRQWYNTASNTENQNIVYDYQGTNMKISTDEQSGISISQNIVDDVYSVLQNDIYIAGYQGYYMQAAASYQHAVTNITLETSKNFVFDAWNGMGRVFNWNTSWDKWDNMQGVCVNFTDYLWVC